MDNKHYEAVKKCAKNNYDEIKILVPKGKKEEYREHAKEQGESLSAFIKRAIEHQIEDDDWK
ncbi:MAG: hypothetical protein IJ642_06270 [Oscillospiraceae bacterium]|nr:hypothetical protein [Oscillospiraceae bacterium]